MSVDTINERAAAEFFTRGTKAEASGSLETAIEHYNHALNEDPDHDEACFRLARLYDLHGMDSQAIELYERVCGGNPVPINALVNLAILYEDSGMYEDARRCLRAIIDTDPNHPRARLYLRDVNSAHDTHADDEQRFTQQQDAVLEMNVMDFELSVRARNALKKMNIESIGDLLRVREQELMAFKNFGETSLSEIKSLLAAKGLRLGQLAEGGSISTLPSPMPPVGGMPAPAAVAPMISETSLTALDRDVPGELMDKPIADLEFSVRSRKALQRLNIVSVGELANKTEDELLGCKNFGQTSLNEIKQILGSYGLALRRVD